MGNRKPLPRTRAKPRRSSRVLDPAHLERVRRLPCQLVEIGGCAGDVEAHHSTAHRHGSQKASDTDTLPLCRGHHRAFHYATGWFAGWTKDKRREWQRVGVLRAQLMVAWRCKEATPW